ncbi:MAG: electron transporter RnfG [Firmicutes bacterium HGW-Firmicutes-21]|nr:MAG: electron transporter RnfG [Firmicutes bacterium HGW-Firmicutes-21]
MKLTKKDLRTIIKPALTLFIICAAVTALLALTDNLTEKEIAAREQQRISDSRKTVLPEAEIFEEYNDSTVTGINSDGGIIGYVFTVTEHGYSGDIQVMVGINKDGKVSGVNLIKHSETPGLGAAAGGPSFLDQFRGLSGKAEVGKNIDSISGATITSRAVSRAVNGAIEQYKTIKESEND